MSGRTDFPLCVYCDDTTSLVLRVNDILEYHCKCGEVVEVENSEGLL